MGAVGNGVLSVGGKGWLAVIAGEVEGGVVGGIVSGVVEASGGNLTVN